MRDAVLFALGERTHVASVFELRAIVTRGASGASAMHDDRLAAVTVSSVTTGWRWNSLSTATDDGVDVLKPDDVLPDTRPGRWLRYESTLRLAPTIGGNSKYLHELTSGPLKRVLLLDKSLDDAEMRSLMFGQVPTVMIEATDDASTDLQLDTGFRWDRTFKFTITIFAMNFRDRRQAAQGSKVTGELVLGANKIDGLIQSLLGGTQLYNVEDGIRNIQVGRAFNFESLEGQRSVVRSRAYAIQATVENPAAPNDAVAVTAISHQAEMTTLGDDIEDEWVAGEDCVTDGIDVALGAGLFKAVTTGTVTMDGSTVTYPGELRSFTADMLTWRDLKADATMTFVESQPGQPEPPVTAGALRIGVTTTDASGVIADRIVARRRVPYGPVVETTIP